jgi:putative flippase GtrA
VIDEVLRRLAGPELADRHGEKVRFLLAGGLNTVVGLAAYPVLYFGLRAFGLGYLAILVISQVFCICFAYLTNKLFVFRTQGNYVRESLKFVAFHSIYFAANVVVLSFMVERLALPPVWAQTGFAFLVIFSSYLWHSRITFSGRPGRP